jgi:hypothetical protein
MGYQGTEDQGLLWLNDAACSEMSIDDFFVEAGHAIDDRVLRVCRTCPVRVSCVRHAYEMQVNGGYFGGMSPGQRREKTMDEAIRFIEVSMARDDRVTGKAAPSTEGTA